MMRADAGAVSFRFADRSQVNGVPRDQAVAAIRDWVAERNNAVPSADLLKVAMIKVDERLSREAPSAGMILTVHDELLFEVPDKATLVS